MKSNHGMPPVRQQVRWWILGLLLIVTVINFVDRQVLSVVAPVLRDTFAMSNADYGIIVAAFQFGMLVGEFPMGYVMDRFGPRFGFSLAVALWSVANGLHAMARSVASFSVFRFLLGTGECANYSGGIKVVAQWFPVRERALAIGIFNGGSMLGAVIAPPLIVAITLAWGWQMAFLLPSGLGLIWVFVWRRIYRSPAQHPDVTPAELQFINQGDADGAEAAAVPAPLRARDLLRMRQTWGLMLCRMLVGPVVQFYIYWMPEYLYRERGLALKTIGLFAWVPFLFGDIGSVGGGWFAGHLIKRGMPVPRARRVTLLAGGALCLLSLLVAFAGTVNLALAAIALVLLGHTFLSANMFATISDVFPSAAVARVTALTGIAGGLSGMAFPWLTGTIVDAGSYAPVFVLASVMPLAGVAVLLFLVPGLPIKQRMES